MSGSGPRSSGIEPTAARVSLWADERRIVKMRRTEDRRITLAPRETATQPPSERASDVAECCPHAVEASTISGCSGSIARRAEISCRDRRWKSRDAKCIGALA